jgi:GMP synthase (glutamine-hydrolysing)
MSTMKVLILQLQSDVGLGRYGRFLSERGIGHVHAGPGTGAPFPDLDAFDAVLVGGTTGTIRELHRDPVLLEASGYLRRCLDARKPAFGVCGGGQLLARVLGAPVTASPRAEAGRTGMRLTAAGRRDPLLAGFPERFDVIEWHRDSFGLPGAADLLVEGDACRNQLFRRSGVVAIQFHLEVVAADVARWADADPAMLAAAGRTREQLVAECTALESEMGRLADLLLENFLKVLVPAGR